MFFSQTHTQTDTHILTRDKKTCKDKIVTGQRLFILAKLAICHSCSYSSICNLLHNMIRHQRGCVSGEGRYVHWHMDRQSHIAYENAAPNSR